MLFFEYKHRDNDLLMHDEPPSIAMYFLPGGLLYHSWGNLANEGRESGQDYERLLEHADRLVLWNYFGLSDYGPEYTEAIVAAVEKYGARRVIISVGLWAAGDDTVTPGQLQRALHAIETSAIPNSWVTPSHLLSDKHWRVISEQWAVP